MTRMQDWTKEIQERVQMHMPAEATHRYAQYLESKADLDGASREYKKARTHPDPRAANSPSPFTAFKTITAAPITDPRD